MPSARTRRWIYGVAVAAVMLATGYGWIAETHAPLWVSLAAAITMGTLAIPNATDDGEDDDDG